MQKASLLSRLVALILNSIVISFVGLIVRQITGEDILGISVGFIIGLLYNTYFWTSNQGQTPGKRVMGLRVVKTNGGNIGVLSAIIRYVGYWINTAIFLLGWIWAIFDGKGQGLHDKLAGTMVVHA